MVFTYTSFRNHNHPIAIERGSAFPTEVSCISICAESNRYRESESDYKSDEYDYNTLASMTRRSSAKIPNINVDGLHELSPEYLALLVSIMNKADCLKIDALGGDAAYACFMGSMLQQNGLRDLRVGSSDTIFSTYQAKLLFEGIALSQSLEKLDLLGNFSDPAEAGTSLANALKRNHSLTTLKLFVNLEDGGSTLGKIFRAAIADKRLREVCMNLRQGDQQLPFDAMVDVLCTDECTVKELDITTIEPAERIQSAMSNERIKTMQNTSVTCYHLQETSLDCTRIMETVGLFRSIQELNLCENRISDLSPLDPLLIGDNLTLRTLNLMCNGINEEDAVEFFRKIPKMTCLRNIVLIWNPFVEVSESWKDILAEVAWKNRSLESISCANYGNLDHEFAEMHVPLSLNRGGRRALEIEHSEPLATNLWPHVLKRAGKLSYFSASDCFFEEDCPSLDSTRPDVVFWLLKEKMLGRCL